MTTWRSVCIPAQVSSSSGPALCAPLFFALQVLGAEEDVSVYDIADHPDFHFRTSDIVIRIWNSENGESDCGNEVT